MAISKPLIYTHFIVIFVFLLMFVVHYSRVINFSSFFLLLFLYLILEIDFDFNMARWKFITFYMDLYETYVSVCTYTYIAIAILPWNVCWAGEMWMKVKSNCLPYRWIFCQLYSWSNFFLFFAFGIEEIYVINFYDIKML